MFKVYVDGQHGTTGLLVNERLEKHPNVKLLKIDYNERHNSEQRKKLLNEADVVFLCLPDEAAKESVSMITNPETKVIDASTAHRTHADWAYGFAELSQAHRKKIQGTHRLSNPGCHATAAISILYPLIQAGIMDGDMDISLFSITGYSGGGKQMIETYKNSTDLAYEAPMQYALDLNHKHVPEIMTQAGLNHRPIFMPVVSNFERGLAVTIPVFRQALKKRVTREECALILKDHYKDAHFVRVHEIDDEEALVDKRMHIQMNNDSNYLDLFIYGNETQFQFIACLDNLGKGASGAAIQNMNIMLGIEENTGL
jgi:N-acetyl-gamma-glutamyl-phosphate reductase